jgi:hypothetical protein
MHISRHRMTLLLELSALERTLTGPERMLREQDVARLIKAAYDEASEAARAEFMARVQPMPTSAWPWSAVQAMVPRGGGGLGHHRRAEAPRGGAGRPHPDPRSGRVGRREPR